MEGQTMLQQEFEERTGMKVTPERYAEIENFYNMTTQKIDKDVFCKEWMEHGESLLLKDFALVIERLEKQVKELKEERDKMADYLLAKAQLSRDIDLDNRAIEMLGHDEVIRRKIDRSYDLFEEDKKYIRCHI